MSVDYKSAILLARNYTKDSHTVSDAYINDLCDVLESVGHERDALSPSEVTMLVTAARAVYNGEISVIDAQIGALRGCLYSHHY